MQKMNLRFLAGTIVAILCSVGIVHIVHGFQVQRHATAYLREARRARKINDSRQSLTFYQRYVSLVPGDSQALAEYGTLLDEAGVYNRAYFVFEQVIRLDPSRDDIRRKQSTVAMRIGRHSDAATFLSQLLKSSPESGELWFALGESQAAQGQFELAKQSLELAITNSPDMLEAYAQLAGLLREKLARSTEADMWLDRLVAANSSNYKAFIIRGQWRLEISASSGLDSISSGATADNSAPKASARLAEALDDARTAVRLAPTKVDANLFAALIAIRSNNLSEAQGYAHKAVEVDSKNESAYELLAGIRFLEGERESGLALLKQGISAVPSSNALRWQLANQLIEKGNFDEAAEIVRELTEQGYSNTQTALLDARLLMGKMEWLTAVRKLEKTRPALSESPDTVKQVDYWIGTCYERLGNPDQQRAAYRRALAIDPLWVPARIAIANAVAAAGRVPDALIEYRRVAGLSDAPAEVLANYGRLLLIDDARRGQSRKSFAEVEEVLKRLESADASGVYAALLKTDLLLAKGNPAEAEAVLTEARVAHPTKLEFWTAAIVLAQRNQNWLQADELFREAEERFPEAISLSSVRGQYLIRRYGADASEHLKALAADVQKRFGTRASTNLEDLAIMAYWIQDFSLANDLATKVAAMQPTSLKIRLLLFEIAYRNRRAEVMKKVLDEVGTIEGHGALWHYGEAVRLQLVADQNEDTGVLADAQEHLAQAQVLRPAWGRLSVLAANIYEKLGSVDLAIDQYREALGLGERDPLVLKHFMLLLFERKRYDEVDRLVRDLGQGGQPVFDEVGQIAAESAFRLGQRDRALELAEKVAEKSNRPEDHVWLGQLLGVLGDTEKAEVTIRHAITLAPSAPEPWAALGNLYARAGQPEKVREVMAEASRSVGTAKVLLVKAQLHELLKEFAAALSSRPDP